VLLGPGEGRVYEMGPLRAVFKAGAQETDGTYAVSEWWLEPRTRGPGPHSHPDDDVFYVLAGTLSVRVGEEWVQAPRGSFVLIPGGTRHDFENRGDTPAGFLDLALPGDFEAQMPGIAEWFRRREPADARVREASD
jgi:quercetin dioxygenase-like cupin family protein